MIKLGAVLLLLGLAVNASANTADVPAPFRGTWAYPTCEAPQETVLVFHRSYLWIGSQGTELRGISLASRQPGDWTRVEDSNGTPYFFRQSNPNELQETFLPRGAPKSAVPSDRWGQVTYQSCQGVLPRSLVLLHGEAVAMLRLIETVSPWCASDRNRCVKALFDGVDVSGDGTLSRAEIARLVRIGTYLAAVSSEEPPDDPQLTSALLAALPVGPLIATAMVNSFDYDNNGTISMQELSQDRVGAMGQLQPGDVTLGQHLDRAKRSLKPLEDLFRGLLR